MKHIFLPALAICLPLLATPVQAEDILSILARKAEAPPRLAPQAVPYSYTMTLNLMEREGDDVSEGQAVLRVDPMQAGGSRVQIISSSNPENEVLQDFIKEIEKPDKTMAEQAEGFWCGSSDAEENQEFNSAEFTVISEDDTQAVLRPDVVKLAELLMQSDAEEADKNERKMIKKMMKRIEGEITVSKPDAEMKAFSVRMARPLTMMIVAKLKTMTVDQTCALAPNGHYHLETMKLDVSGKALGKAFGQEMDIRISELTPLP